MRIRSPLFIYGLIGALAECVDQFCQTGNIPGCGGVVNDTLGGGSVNNRDGGLECSNSGIFILGGYRFTNTLDICFQRR